LNDGNFSLGVTGGATEFYWFFDIGYPPYFDDTKMVNSVSFKKLLSIP